MNGSTKLYGRTKELAQLQTALETYSIVLLSGPTGCGKSRLVQSLPKIDLMGTCEAHGQAYGVFRQAIQQYLQTLPIEQHEPIREAIGEQIKSSSDLDLLLATFPNLAMVLGKRSQSEKESSAPSTEFEMDAAVHPMTKTSAVILHNDPFHVATLCRFFDIITSGKIMLLENFHGIDKASLFLIGALVENKVNIKLLCTCSNDMEPYTGPFVEIYRNLKNPSFLESRNATCLEISNLGWEDVHDWVADCLDQPSSTAGLNHVCDLADVLFDHTRGNPLFITYLIQYLQHANLIRHNGSSGYDWDKEQLMRHDLPKRLNILLIQLIENQSQSVQECVKTASALACSEPRIDYEMFQVALRKGVAECVGLAAQQGLLEFKTGKVSSFSESGHIQIARIELQRASYSLIPESEKALFHLKLARRLWKSVSNNSNINNNVGLEKHLYLITDQFRFGLGAVTDSREQNFVVGLALQAGKKAMGNASFKTAAFYFEFAIEALGDSVWSDEVYDQCLTLFNSAAEAYYCTGEFEKMDTLLNGVFDHSKCLLDTLRAKGTLVCSYGARQQLKNAVDVALDTLDQLGEPLSRNPSKLQIAAGFLKTKWLLRGKPDRFFARLPPLTDVKKVATLQMLAFTFQYCFGVMPETGILSMFRSMERTIQWGVCSASIATISGYSFLLSGFFHQNEEGYRYAKQALDLVEHFEARSWLPRVYMGAYGYVNHWFDSFHTCREPLKVAYQVAQETGDIEGSLWCASVYLMVSFLCAVPLSELEHDARSFVHTEDFLGQTAGLCFTLPYWEFISDIMGSSQSPPRLTGPVKTVDDALDRANNEKNKLAVSQYYTNKAVYCCLTADYGAVVSWAKKERDTFNNDVDIALIFFVGVAAFADAYEKRGLARLQNIALGIKYTRKMKKWAKCPSNFQNKHALLEAELSAIQGKHGRAIHWFNVSVTAAKREGYLHEEGLAYERWAAFLKRTGGERLAIPYLHLARHAYDQWGAQTLVDRLDKEMVG